MPLSQMALLWMNLLLRSPMSRAAFSASRIRSLPKQSRYSWNLSAVRVRNSRSSLMSSLGQQFGVQDGHLPLVLFVDEGQDAVAEVAEVVGKVVVDARGEVGPLELGVGALWADG